jgi:hypothetical protein
LPRINRRSSIPRAAVVDCRARIAAVEQGLAALAAERPAVAEAYARALLPDADLDATELRGGVLRRHLAALREGLPLLVSKLEKLERAGESYGRRLGDAGMELESLRAESSIALVRSQA